ncbi:BRO family protein, partial [Mycobacterium sp. NS-7484]|uniref:BRO-N domain-containing protein n=1 Tax=Mycobacterium sp. NS-7484 TaxID=1834161 RepID=UPI00210105FD
MSADLLPFTYVNTTVRVVMIDDQPWFVLADLCVVLGIANVGNVADRLDQVNIRRTDVENARGQMRQTVVVNEAGMYEVVIRSDKPEAVAFRRWITGTVLPEIRRTGSFKA